MIDVTVPELAESISEASVESWQAAPGDIVKAGDVLVTIETDKVALEVPAPQSGALAEIVKQAGEDVKSGEVLARIDTAAAATESAKPKASQPAAKQPDSGSAGRVVAVQVPELAESIAEASVSEWFKQPGEPVTTGEVIATIETDKVTLEVPAPVTGTLVEHKVAAGEDVKSGQEIAQVQEGEVAVAAATQVSASQQDDVHHGVSPAARKLAAEQGVDLSSLRGTGKDGLITKGDVLAAAKQPAATAPPAKAAAPALSVVAGSRAVRRERMSKLRARVAERLLQSQRQTAMLTTFNEADMSAVIGMRKRYREEFEKSHGVKLGFMSFFVKAVTAALRQHPIINAAIDGNDIVYHDYCDIGIAVGSPRGLVVPVLRDAEALGMADIEKNISDFGQRAQSGKLELEELTGGTFTITNGGVFGSMLSTPIINPPQSAILGVHATKERPVVVDGEIVVRPVNYLALSYDHRLIDGRDAVLFLVAVKQALEDPSRLVLGI